MFLTLLGAFASVSLLAVGGANALAPEMHRLLVVRYGLIDDGSFTQLLALAQAAPGPNILAGSMMGYWIGGLPGLAGATLGLLGPAALLAWLVAGLTRRLAHAWWLKPAQAGLVPVALGLIAASGVVLAEAAWSFPLAPVITAAATLFCWLSGRSPLWALAAGGAFGALVL